MTIRLFGASAAILAVALMQAVALYSEDSPWTKAVGEMKTFAESLPEGSARKNVEKTVEELGHEKIEERLKGFQALVKVSASSLKKEDKKSLEEEINAVIKVSGWLIVDGLTSKKPSEQKSASAILDWVLTNKFDIDPKPLFKLFTAESPYARAVGFSYFEKRNVPDALPEIIKAAEGEKDNVALDAAVRTIVAYADAKAREKNIEQIKKLIEVLKRLRSKADREDLRKYVDGHVGLLTSAWRRAECKCAGHGKPAKEIEKTKLCQWCDCVSEGEERAPCLGGTPARQCKCHQ